MAFYPNSIDQSLYRPYANTNVASTMYIDTSGSDTSGDGSINAPFATPTRAINAVPINNNTTVTFNCSSGIFEFPKTASGLNFINFVGNYSVADTRNITSVTASNTMDGLIIVVDGATLTNDEWRGRIVSFTGSPVNNVTGNVYRNVGNTIYITLFYSTTMPTVTTSSTISLLTLNTTLRYVGGTGTVLSSTQFNLQYLNFSGDGAGRVQFANATDKIEYQNCIITTNRMNSGIGGGMYFRNCSIQTTGDTTAGMMTAVRGGNMLLESCSFIGDANASAGERRIDIELGSIVEFRGMNVMRSMEEIRIEGSSLCLPNPSNSNFILFEDTPSTTCTNAYRVNMQGKACGGNIMIPKSVGTITAARTVVAQRSSKIFLGNGSSVTDATGTNTFSADGGSTTSITNADGTYIAVL